MGLKRTFNVVVRLARATFFLLTKEQVPKTSITLRDSTAKRGQVIKTTLRVPSAKEKHPLRIRAFTPSGLPADWLNQVVLVDGEDKEIEIPVAENDPQGDWRISAINLYTNEAATVKLTVR